MYYALYFILRTNKSLSCPESYRELDVKNNDDDLGKEKNSDDEIWKCDKQKQWQK